MVTIIHLSDLHFVRDAASFHMRKILLAEVEKAVRDRGPGEKLLIITGDFHNYLTEGYEDAIDFLNQLIDKMDIDRTQDVFVVPGNHDIGNDKDMEKCFPGDKWKMRRDSSCKTLREDWNNPKSRKISADYLEWRMESYQPYCNFVKELGIYPSDKDTYYPATVHVRNWRGKLNILHLNTTLVADGGNKDNQLADVTTASDPETWKGLKTEEIPALAIGHNHFYDLEKAQQTSLEGSYLDYNVSAYLCGDTHLVSIDASDQIIPLDGRITPERLVIPNIVCAKGMMDLSDSYSDFGYYIHEWDEETDKVKLLFHRWKKEFKTKTVLEGDDQGYRMRRTPKTAKGPAPEKTPKDPDAELKDYLKAVLESDREGHPSFAFMNAEDESGKKVGMPEIDIKCHTSDGTGSVSVSSAIQASWRKPGNHSIVITGDGGSGKTVSLFNTSIGLWSHYGIPAVYIPLYRLVTGEGKCLSVSDYLKDRFTAKWNDIEQLSERKWKRIPSMMLLLDGFNEIPGEKRRIVLGQINEWSKTHPGTQLIAVSRPMDGLNLEKELAKSPVSIELEGLDEKTIRAYLKKVGRQAPKKDSPIWSELAYPHFLMLYIKTNALYGKKNVGYPLRPRTMKSGGALMWNFLQRELLRQDNEGWVLRCAIACEYILPYLAYQMTKKYSFIVSLDQALEWINEAIDELRNPFGKLPVHLHQLANAYKRMHSSQFSIDKLPDVNWGDVVLQETGLLISKQQNGITDQEENIEYSFVHQHFRDCLAALHLVNHAEMIDNQLPDVWDRPQDNNTLDYISELIELDAFQSIWDTNRNTRPTNNVITATLLEILARKKQKELLEKPLPLNFSGMDLRDLSLAKYLGKEENLGLFEDPKLTVNTKMNLQTFVKPGHRGRVVALAETPDGLLISGSWDSTIKIWDSTTGACLRVLKGHKKEVTCLALMQNGCIVSGSLDKTLRIWDPATGECLHVLKGHRAIIDCVAILQDGCVVSGSYDKTLRIWDPATGDCLYVLKGHENVVTCLAVLPNGNIVSGSRDHTLRIWNPSMGECSHIITGHKDDITCLVVLQNRYIASGSRDKTIRIWDCVTGECRHVLNGHTEGIRILAILPNGLIVSGAWDSSIGVWDPQRGKCLSIYRSSEFGDGYMAVLRDGRIVLDTSDGELRIVDFLAYEWMEIPNAHDGMITCLFLLQDGRIVSGSWDYSMQIWDSATGECLQVINGNECDIRCLALLTDERIVSGSDDKTIRIWNSKTGKCEQTFKGYPYPITRLELLKDGHIAGASSDGTFRIWDASTGECLKEYGERADRLAQLPDGRIVIASDDKLLIHDSKTGQCLKKLKGHNRKITCLSVLNNECIVSGSWDETLRVWNPITGACLQILDGHHGFITCISVLTKERIVSGSDDGTIQIWNYKNGKCLRNLTGHKKGITCLAVLQNGRIVSGSEDCTLRIWNPSGTCWRALIGHESFITCLAILEDGRIVSGSEDQTLRIWDSTTGECLHILRGHENKVTCVAIMEDGKIVSGATDGTLRIWDTTTGENKKTIWLLESNIDWGKMDFSRAAISQEIKEALWNNGAIVK